MNGSLITKYHNNGKKLPRGYLGRNCIISDHFREWRYWWGWEGRPEFAGKVVLSCLFTVGYPKLLALCPLTSSISSADLCFPFFTSHLSFTGHTVFCMAFFFPLEAKLKGPE